MIVVLSGVSGSGKTTMASLLEKKGYNRSVSYTTRLMRPNEFDKVDYHFISEEEFERKIEANFFVEYVKLFGNYYGTGANRIKSDQNFVMCLSLQGYLAAKKKWKKKFVGIYIKPPNMDE